MIKVSRRTATVSFIPLLFLVSLLLLWNASAVLASSNGIPAEARRAEINNRKDVSKIMFVLESRGQGKRTLKKAADKISEMNGRNLRLMSSLCDRISEDAGTPAADVAYSLLTALIVLS